MADETNSTGNGNSAAAPGATEQPQRQLVLQKLYVKDMSFESPNSPQVFAGQAGDPQIQFNLKSGSRQVGENAWEVLLTITVEAKGAEDRSLFLVELQQAGIFNLLGYSEEEIRPLLGSYCPSVLYPYAREAISEIISKGGFPQLLLQPINFDAVYVQAQQQQAQQQQVDMTPPETPAGNA
jgi:preprotein translocase subunit SecB